MYYSRLCAILWNCQDTFVSIRTGKRAFKLRLGCLFLRSQYLHVNLSTLHVVCQYVSKIISRFQKFCRIFLSERKMSTMNFKVSTNEYDIKKCFVLRGNGLNTWFERCEYDEYEEIDQNSEKNKNYRMVTPVTFKDFLLWKPQILNGIFRCSRVSEINILQYGYN